MILAVIAIFAIGVMISVSWALWEIKKTIKDGMDQIIKALEKD
jgi:hypothetical protein